MTDVSQLLPGPELDAMVAEILGTERFRVVMRDHDGQVDGYIETTSGFTRDEAKRELERLGGGWTVEAVSYREYSTDPAANADVERWLVEHVPTHKALVSRYNLPMIIHGTPRYEVHYEADLQCWEAGYYCSVRADQYTLQRDSAFTSETNSDHIAARLLAVCRFAVRVAEEIKRMENRA